MSGQRFSALKDGSLTFAPALSCPFSLPFLTTGGVGTFSCNQNAFTVKVTLGKLRVGTLSVEVAGRTIAYSGRVSITAGESIQWPTSPLWI